MDPLTYHRGHSAILQSGVVVFYYLITVRPQHCPPVLVREVTHRKKVHLLSLPSHSPLRPEITGFATFLAHLLLAH